jgi:hypothetical protein
LFRAETGFGTLWERLAVGYRRANLHYLLLRERLTGEWKPGRGVDAGRIVWIFGTGRSGSTWLRSMLGELPGFRVWEEPLVGRLFGEFYEAEKERAGDRNFIMSEAARGVWSSSIRRFVLDGARYAQPGIGSGDHLVIKEPNGSIGAPLLSEALPESRLIFLIRDPRDVVASVLDGARAGGWLYEWAGDSAWKRQALADEKPDEFVEQRARVYLRNAGAARRAFESHAGPKALVRYEDLVEDTAAVMEGLVSELSLPVGEKESGRAVAKHAWENVPLGGTGTGKFYRKGRAGSWREDLTPGQVRLVERATEPLLRDFYRG